MATLELQDAGVVVLRYRTKTKRDKRAEAVWRAAKQAIGPPEGLCWIGRDGYSFMLIAEDWTATKARLKKWADEWQHEMVELHVACYDVKATPAWARSGQPDTRMKGGE